MNVPNFLTLVRIALTFLFVWLLLADGLVAKGCALLVFLLASVTDYWDGEIARRSGQITQLGKIMDPIADKLLTLSAFIVFAWMGLVPWWMSALIAIRDVSITAFRLFMPSKSGDTQAAQAGGKNKTALQFIFIIGVLGYLAFIETTRWNEAWTPDAVTVIRIFMGLIVALTLWSGIGYFLSTRGVFARK
jgi:CDP-diacylglycerol--glycerol-3-phosphate 3-phosphatidyltransferase